MDIGAGTASPTGYLWNGPLEINPSGGYRPAPCTTASSLTPPAYSGRHRRYDVAEGRSCGCYTPWFSVVPPPPCPLHGQAHMPTVTC